MQAGKDSAVQRRGVRTLQRTRVMLCETLDKDDNLLVYYAGHRQLDPLTESAVQRHES